MDEVLRAGEGGHHLLKLATLLRQIRLMHLPLCWGQEARQGPARA